MLGEMERTLTRLQAVGLASSKAAFDLRQLHKRYLPILQRIQGCEGSPHVMCILAEEAVEGLCVRFELLGLPIVDEEETSAPLYWRNYLKAVTTGEIAGLEYTRFRQAQSLIKSILEDSYENALLGDDYKTLRYTYALSNLPLPEWFVPVEVPKVLEEIVTALGFLWFSVVDYAESSYCEQKGA